MPCLKLFEERFNNFFLSVDDMDEEIWYKIIFLITDLNLWRLFWKVLSQLFLIECIEKLVYRARLKIIHAFSFDAVLSIIYEFIT